VETLRAAARQHVVVLGGPRRAVDAALTDALIQQPLFARAECVVVPVRTDDDAVAATLAKKKKPAFDRAGFVTKPAPADERAWIEYVNEEIATATSQGAAEAPAAGVVIAIRRDGSVARRGVGKPPWKELVDELQAGERGPSSGSPSMGGSATKQKKKKETAAAG